MAKHATSIPAPTRRIVFGGALLMPCLGASAAVAKPKPKVTDAEFIRLIEGLHYGGGLAARRALAAGMRPEQMVVVITYIRDAKPRDLPALQFKIGDAYRTFRPRGEDL